MRNPSSATAGAAASTTTARTDAARRASRRFARRSMRASLTPFDRQTVAGLLDAALVFCAATDEKMVLRRGGTMAGEPTLYHGNESVDGWVEYLQNMLLIKTQLGNHHYKSGTFDDFTLDAVKEFQEKKRLKVDGIVGDQTWAVLRGEPDAPAPHDDGRAPGTYVEQGIEMRFT